MSVLVTFTATRTSHSARTKHRVRYALAHADLRRRVRRRTYPAAESFKDSHSDFGIAVHRQAVYACLADSRLDPTHTESSILKRHQHVGNTAMPVGHSQHEIGIPDVDREHVSSPLWPLIRLYDPSGSEDEDSDTQPAGGCSHADPDRGAPPGAEIARATLPKIRLADPEGVVPRWRCHHTPLAGGIQGFCPSGRNKISNIDAAQAPARRFPKPQP